MITQVFTMSSGIAKGFTNFEVSHIPQEENFRFDHLARLASTKGPGLNRMVIQETLEASSTEMEEVMIL